MKVNEFGRSMIEMLGVLAIVGVLSVGGIAGYSKAMKKHKYNQLSAEFTTFIQELYPYKRDFAQEKERLSPSAHFYIASYLKSMGILPDKWSIVGTGIRDSMGNRFTPFIRNTSGDLSYGTLSFDYVLTSDDRDALCVFLFSNTILNLSEIIISTAVWLDKASLSSGAWYGDAYCQKSSRRCIRDMTMSDVLEMCGHCKGDEESPCSLMLVF